MDSLVTLSNLISEHVGILVLLLLFVIFLRWIAWNIILAPSLVFMVIVSIIRVFYWKFDRRKWLNKYNQAYIPVIKYLLPKIIVLRDDLTDIYPLPIPRRIFIHPYQKSADSLLFMYGDLLEVGASNFREGILHGKKNRDKGKRGFLVEVRDSIYLLLSIAFLFIFFGVILVVGYSPIIAIFFILKTQF